MEQGVYDSTKIEIFKRIDSVPKMSKNDFPFLSASKIQISFLSQCMIDAFF